MKQLTFPYYEYHVCDDKLAIAMNEEDKVHRLVIKIDVTDFEYKAVKEICEEYGVNNLPKDYLSKNTEVLGLYLRLTKKADGILYEMLHDDVWGNESFEETMRAYYMIDDYDEMPNYSEADAVYIVSNITKRVFGAPLEFDKEYEDFLRKAGSIK